MISGAGPITSNVISRSLPLRIAASTGQITQVRNHVKMYPWRFNRNNRECYLDPAKTPYTDRFNVNEFNHKKKRKDWQIVIPKDKDSRFNAYHWNDSYRSDPKEAKETSQSKLRRFQDSLRDRGSARESKPYHPPENVQEKVINIFKTQLTSDGSVQADGLTTSPNTDSILATSLSQSKLLKFNLISRCVKQFDHHMPNSYLVDVVTVGDVVKYFSTPVRGINPYECMLRRDDSLPHNLNIIAEPLRYNRDSDEFFGGYTALPGVISKVPGLRASKKYPVYGQREFQWPDV